MIWSNIQGNSGASSSQAADEEDDDEDDEDGEAEDMEAFEESGMLEEQDEVREKLILRKFEVITPYFLWI